MLTPCGRYQPTVTESLVGLEALLKDPTCNLEKIHNVLQSFIKSLASMCDEDELRSLRDRVFESLRQSGYQSVESKKLSDIVRDFFGAETVFAEAEKVLLCAKRQELSAAFERKDFEILVPLSSYLPEGERNLFALGVCSHYITTLSVEKLMVFLFTCFRNNAASSSWGSFFVKGLFKENRLHEILEMFKRRTDLVEVDLLGKFFKECVKISCADENYIQDDRFAFLIENQKKRDSLRREIVEEFLSISKYEHATRTARLIKDKEERDATLIKIALNALKKRNYEQAAYATELITHREQLDRLLKERVSQILSESMHLFAYEHPTCGALLIKNETERDSALKEIVGKALNCAYKWKINAAVFIKNEEERDEALRLIAQKVLGLNNSEISSHFTTQLIRSIGDLNSATLGKIQDKINGINEKIKATKQKIAEAPNLLKQRVCNPANPKYKRVNPRTYETSLTQKLTSLERNLEQNQAKLVEIKSIDDFKSINSIDQCITVSKVCCKEMPSENLKKGFFRVLSLILSKENPEWILSFDEKLVKKTFNILLVLKYLIQGSEVEKDIEQFLLQGVFKFSVDLIKRVESFTTLELEGFIEKLFTLKDLKLPVNLNHEVNLALKETEKELQSRLREFRTQIEAANPIISSKKVPRMTCILERYNTINKDLNYFDQKSEEVVSEVAKKIREVLPKGLVLYPKWKNKKVKLLFDHLLVFLGDERRKIADHQKSLNSEKFGLWRASSKDQIATPLRHRYREYGDVLLDHLLKSEAFINSQSDALKKVQSKINGINENIKETKQKITEAANLLKERVYNPTNSHYKIINPRKYAGSLAQKLTSLEKNLEQEEARLVKIKTITQIELGIKGYEEIGDLSFFTKDVEEVISEGDKRIQRHVILQPRGEMELRLSYFIRKSCSQDPNSVEICHQDYQYTLRSSILLQKYFILALSADKVQDLKKNLAIFRFIFGHTAPYFRGSAAIAEWFEKAIYEYRGYKASYAPQFVDANYRPTGDLDAFIVSLSEYIKMYKERMTLKKI